MLIELFITILTFWQNYKHFAVEYYWLIMSLILKKDIAKIITYGYSLFFLEMAKRSIFCGSAKKKSYYFGEFALLVRFMNRTTSGIVLSEFVLSGDPL